MSQNYDGRGTLPPIKTFMFEGTEQRVSYKITTEVTDNVDCDVYEFLDDPKKDLGIIRIKPGGKTPLQKVLNGDKTIEGHISGRGKLTVIKAGGGKTEYAV